MRNILILNALIVLMFVAACARTGIDDSMPVTAGNSTAQASPTPSDNAPRISLEDAKKDFDAGTAIFIDARAAEAYQTEHIKGAINITSAMLADKIKELPKDKKLIVYCS